MTAFGADTIARRGISEAKEYLALTPNVWYGESGEGGNRSIKITVRGIANVDLGEVTSANSSGYYLDEINIRSTANGVINSQLYDMERIEVLRGPHGTYFERNALGGALNLTTKQPTDHFEGSLQADAGRFDTLGFNGMLNIPLSERVFTRFVASYEESDGIVRNVHASGTPDSGFEYVHVRGAAKILPNDRWTIDLSVNTNEEEGADASVPSGVLYLDTKSIFGSAFVPVDTVGFYASNRTQFDRDAEEFNNNDVLMVNGRISYEFDRVTLRSITGYVHSDHKRRFDQDNTFADAIIRENDYAGTSVSEELRLQSTGGCGIDWTLGAYYAHDEIDQLNSVLPAPKRCLIILILLIRLVLDCCHRCRLIFASTKTNDFFHRKAGRCSVI